MSRLRWPDDRDAVVTHFNARHSNPEGNALLRYAFDAVDALHYLADVDAGYETTRSVGDHNGDVVDVAHARWATGTAITALDLVAAAFGRFFGNHVGPKELDFGSFSESNPSKQLRAVLAIVPSLAKQWISDVNSDSDFQLISGARDALTHRRLPRSLCMSFVSGVVEPRLDLRIGSSQVPVGDLVKRSRDLATRHLVDLLKLLPSL